MAVRSHVAVAALMALGARAQDALQSGPATGAAFPKAPVYAASGPRAGQEFDAGAVVAARCGALLFVPELTRNIAPMVSEMDRLAVEYECLGFRAFTVVFARDRTASEAQIQRSSAALHLSNPMTVSTEGQDGPGGHALNRKASLTLVLARDGKVHKSVAFTDTGRQDFPRLRALVEEVTGPMPTDEAELRRRIAASLPADADALRARLLDRELELRRLRLERARAPQNQAMDGRRRPAAGDAAAASRPASRPAGPLVGRAPDDPRLRELLRAAIQKAATKAELDQVFADIDARVAEDAATLRPQAVEMFRLILGLGYGTDDARARAQAYVTQHGK